MRAESGVDIHINQLLFLKQNIASFEEGAFYLAPQNDFSYHLIFAEGKLFLILWHTLF